MEGVLTSRSSSDPAPPWARWAAVGIVCLAGLLFLTVLDAPLLEPQEARYAEIPRQMLALKQWLVPTLQGQDYLDKPPLLYWSVMVCYRLLGISDTSARLVPGLSGVLLVLITLGWGWRILGWRVGLSGGLILCLLPEFIYRGRMLTFDVLLALWVVTAWATGHMACRHGTFRLGWWLVSALCCGLGLLTKGPVALLLVAVPLVVLAWPRWRAGLGYLAVALLVAAPWYAVILSERPEFAGYFFWRHNVTRFLAPFDHAEPVWYYVPGLLMGSLPWWLAVFHSSRSRFRLRESGWPLLCFAWTVLFFSLAGCKRPTYLLPALPPLAVTLGWLVRDHWQRPSRPAAWAAGLTLLAGAVLGIMAAIGQVAVTVGWIVAGLALVGLIALCFRSQSVNWAMTAVLMASSLCLAVQHVLPAYNQFFSLRDSLVCLQAGEPPVVCYPYRYDSVTFYRPEGEVRVFTVEQHGELFAYLREQPGSLLLVKSPARLQRLLREMPAELEYRTARHQGAITVGRVVPRLAQVARTNQ
jgi:4-amino-4-deoxy-L-arabinose transferase-like glycosyltransferase